jgi:hypothetical protein
VIPGATADFECGYCGESQTEKLSPMGTPPRYACRSKGCTGPTGSARRQHRKWERVTEFASHMADFYSGAEARQFRDASSINAEEMPPQEEVKMEFHFIKTPSFLPASTQWVVLGDMWAINDYQFMSERVAYLQDVQIQGKKTKSLWHVHQKYMSKQSIVEGPAKAMVSRLKDKKNCKVVVIKPTTKAN